MTVYTCSNCDKKFGRSNCYNYHTQKKVCFKAFSCDICGKLCKNKQSLRTHKLSACKSRDETTQMEDITNHVTENFTKKEMLEMVRIIQQEIKDLRNKSTNSTCTTKITNNINNNQINNNLINNGIINNINQTINIVGFGKEDLTKLDVQEIFKCLKAGYYYPNEMTFHINFNKDYPENHNIQLTNVRDSYIKYFDGMIWKVTSFDDFFENMIDHRMNFVSKIKEKNHTLYSGLNNKIKEVLTNINDLEPTSLKYKEMKNEFRHKIIEKRPVVAETQKKFIRNKNFNKSENIK